MWNSLREVHSKSEPPIAGKLDIDETNSCNVDVSDNVYHKICKQ